MSAQDPNCTFLNLAENKIGDKGLEAFSAALASGAMAQLRVLRLGSNKIGDKGLEALSRIFH